MISSKRQMMWAVQKQPDDCSLRGAGRSERYRVRLTPRVLMLDIGWTELVRAATNHLTRARMPSATCP